MTNPKATSPSADPAGVALAALGWLLSDGERAQRFLDLTGLTPDGLRDAVGQRATHRAIFAFLAAHEPDLLGAAEALGLPPQALIDAQRNLER